MSEQKKQEDNKDDSGSDSDSSTFSGATKVLVSQLQANII